MTPKDNSSDYPPENVKSVGDKIADVASQVKTKMGDLGRTATEKIGWGPYRRSGQQPGQHSIGSARKWREGHRLCSFDCQ